MPAIDFELIVLDHLLHNTDVEGSRLRLHVNERLRAEGQKQYDLAAFFGAMAAMEDAGSVRGEKKDDSGLSPRIYNIGEVGRKRRLDLEEQSTQLPHLGGGLLPGMAYAGR